MQRKIIGLTPSVNGSSTALEQANFLFLPKEIENRSGFLMMRVSTLWKDYHDKVLKRQYNLNFIQYAVLLSIFHLTLQNKQLITQVLVAKYTKLDLMTLFKTFKELEARNYISRQTHPADARAKTITLTQQGRELTEQVIKTIQIAERRLLKTLGKKTKYFKRYLSILLEMNN